MTLFPEPEVGTALSLELLLPEAPKNLVLKGVVLRRHAARHVAIRFIRAPAEQEDFLETYLSRSLNDLPHFDGSRSNPSERFGPSPSLGPQLDFGTARWDELGQRHLGNFSASAREVGHPINR